jgi:hypothetical protein
MSKKNAGLGVAIFVMTIKKKYGLRTIVQITKIIMAKLPDKMKNIAKPVIWI